MRQPRAEWIWDRDEDPVALPSLGELLFAFIVVASSTNPAGLGLQPAASSASPRRMPWGIPLSSPSKEGSGSTSGVRHLLPSR